MPIDSNPKRKLICSGETFEVFCNPNQPIHPQASAVTGLAMSDAGTLTKNGQPVGKYS